MTNEEFKKQCPILCKTINLHPNKASAVLAQAKFFKERTFIFDVLDIRDATVLKLRYGVEDGKMLTLYQVSDMLNLTHQRVSQIENRAYEVLRQPRCMMWLRDYTDKTFDKSLLNTLDINYNNLIKRDIVRLLLEQDIELLEDIPVEQLNIKFHKTEQHADDITNALKQAGFNTCADLIRYMEKHTNLLDVGIGYPEHTAIIHTLADMIERGKAQIMSPRNKQKYEALIKRRDKHQQVVRPKYDLSIANNKEYKTRQKEQKLIKELILEGNIDRAKTEPDKVMLEEVGLSLRTYNRLKQYGLNTVKDVMDFYVNNNGNLQVIRHFGPALEREVVEKFNVLGVYLNATTPSQELFMDTVKRKPGKVLIENLHFSKRVYNYLRDQGIYTVKDLMEKPINVTDVKNLGKRSQREIMDKMQQLGIDCGVSIIDNK